MKTIFTVPNPDLLALTAPVIGQEVLVIVKSVGAKEWHGFKLKRIRQVTQHRVIVGRGGADVFYRSGRSVLSDRWRITNNFALKLEFQKFRNQALDRAAAKRARALAVRERPAYPAARILARMQPNTPGARAGFLSQLTKRQLTQIIGWLNEQK